MKNKTKRIAMLEAEVAAFSATKRGFLPLNPYHFGSRCYYAFNRGFNDGRTYTRLIEWCENTKDGFSYEDNIAFQAPVLSYLNQKYIAKQKVVKNEQ